MCSMSALKKKKSRSGKWKVEELRRTADRESEGGEDVFIWPPKEAERTMYHITQLLLHEQVHTKETGITMDTKRTEKVGNHGKHSPPILTMPSPGVVKFFSSQQDGLVSMVSLEWLKGQGEPICTVTTSCLHHQRPSFTQ